MLVHAMYMGPGNVASTVILASCIKHSDNSSTTTKEYDIASSSLLLDSGGHQSFGAEFTSVSLSLMLLW